VPGAPPFARKGKDPHYFSHVANEQYAQQKAFHPKIFVDIHQHFSTRPSYIAGSEFTYHEGKWCVNSAASVFTVRSLEGVGGRTRRLKLASLEKASSDPSYRFHMCSYHSQDRLYMADGDRHHRVLLRRLEYRRQRRRQQLCHQ